MGVACCACTSSSVGGSAQVVDVSHHNDGLLRHPRQVGGGRRSLSLSSSRRDDSLRSEHHRVMHSTIALWPATRLAPGVAEEMEEQQRQQQQQGQAHPLVPTNELSQQAISPHWRRSISLRTDSDSRFDSVSQTETELPHTDIRQRRIGRATKYDETIEPPEETPTFPGDMMVDYDYSVGTILEVRSGTIAPLESRADSFATAIDAAGAVYREGAAEGSSGAFRKITSRASSGGWARSTASDLAAQMLAGAFGVSPETDAFGGDGLQQQAAAAVVVEQAPRAGSSSAHPSPSSSNSSKQHSSRTRHSSSSGEGRQPFLAITVPPTTVAVAPPSNPPRPSIPSVRCAAGAMTPPDGGHKQNMLVFSMMPHSPTQGNFQYRDENMIAGGHEHDRSDAPQAHVAAVRPLASDSDDELLISAIASAAVAPQIVQPHSPFSPVKHYAMNVSGYQQRRDGVDGDAEGCEDPTSPVFRTSTGSSITAAPSLPTRNPLALHIKSTPFSIVHGGAQSCISSLRSHEHDMAPASPSIVAAALAAGSDAPQPPSHASHLPKLLLVPSLFPARISSSSNAARHHRVSGGGDFQHGNHNNNADLGSSWEHGSLSLNPFQVPNNATTTMAHLHDTCAATPTSQSCNLAHMLAA
ncbi:Hypothetical protein, putative [Bodo saltans]|uniref:Uncharacterized protein n=1 Tax=Bodo saltans TaxID=75058 RepID=A0A0S4JJ22_BODSA|nr:Hypothetical protein, putative [Bodo saltans]|eukprot:CUG90175.1 Hypothetical protein, putative [Bodo saltans]